MSHTIVLLQPTSSVNTRTYSDFESAEKAMDGICQLFEEKLKKENPHTKKITYDIRSAAAASLLLCCKEPQLNSFSRSALMMRALLSGSSLCSAFVPCPPATSSFSLIRFRTWPL